MKNKFVLMWLSQYVWPQRHYIKTCIKSRQSQNILSLYLDPVCLYVCDVCQSNNKGENQADRHRIGLTGSLQSVCALTSLQSRNL